MKNCRPFPFVFLLMVFATLATSVALAELKSFTLDQSKSGLIISGDFAGSPFTPQGSGALTTSYTGTIQADLTGQVITFLGGSTILTANNGTWQPAAGGAAGSAVANYGGTVSLGIATGNAAVRNMRFDVTNNSSTTVISGTFPATNLTFFFPAGANTTLDYRVTGLINASGSTNLAGGFPNTAPTNATLVIQASEYILTIPVDISGVVPTSSGDVNYRLQGNLVSKAPAPNASIPLRIIAFGVTNNQATMTMSTTLSQHFTILGSTNFTVWSTNDQFTATATNTTRIFALPSSSLVPRQYLRVRQD